MLKKLSFNKRLTLYLLLVFVIFAFLILLMQYNREKEFRKRQLENTLDNITEMTYKYVVNKKIHKSEEYDLIDSLMNIVPRQNIRITLIDARGVVRYDSEVIEIDQMENHLKRPELQLSLRNKFGSNIRSSNTTGKEYFYFSKFYDNFYIRSAALYDMNVKDFLKAEKLFILYLFLIFIAIGTLLQFMTKRFSRTIVNLKDFALSISRGDQVKNIDFPSDELGVVSAEIINIYNQLNVAKESLNIEKNKLFNHLHVLNEGVAFFGEDKEKVFSNNHFIHNLNHIAEQPVISAKEVFKVQELKPVVSFIKEQLEKKEEIKSNDLPQFQMEIEKNNKYFEVMCIFFEDRNFEIVLKDVTKLEKRKRIKQQMTSNISHELKTPAATILGYLETLQENKLEEKQKKHFIKKAFMQARKLSDLLDDLSTLNNIEEAKSQFRIENTDLVKIIQDVEDNLQLNLDKNKVKTKFILPEKLIMNGNKTLLFSIFYNLFDNAIKYGGEGIEIIVNNIMDENDFLHFSFANTGNTIEDEHLNRIFERFYRVDSGRSRKSGGTGLGLAIVKNAVQLHGGNITARKYKNGGVEFLFTLSKG